MFAFTSLGEPEPWTPEPMQQFLISMKDFDNKKTESYGVHKMLSCWSRNL